MRPTMLGRVRWCSLLLALAPGPLAAQEWNDGATMALVDRAIAARQRAAPDSSLRSYHTTAHGFVFFLGQLGRGVEAPPRLIKADELLVDVYWQAPSLHRQVIRGWRDGRWLPTDIHYHRDHLGIVANNFGDRIRIGEGDEVRDVVHPLAPDGPAVYDYRLADSLQVASRDTVRRLIEVLVRPRDPGRPRVVGTLSLDASSGDLVRFRFSFTPSAYLDTSLEDLSVTLENAIVEGRWWLPWRQEIEIRRRLSWLDLPARSIIRGRWEIGEYQLNAAVPGSARFGPGIGGLRQPADSTFPDDAPPLATLLPGMTRPVEAGDLDALRDEIAGLAGGEQLRGLARTRLGISSISDVARVNRVQGLTLGLGLALPLAPGLVLRPRAGFGTADDRLTGEAELALRHRGVVWALAGGRSVRDLADRPIVSGVVNSLLSQEGGRDLGDYVRLDRVAGSAAWQRGGSLGARGEIGIESSRSLAVDATPAAGHYRPNPALGAGTVGVMRLALDLGRTRVDRTGGRRVGILLEGGAGDREFARVGAHLWLRAPVSPGAIDVRAEAGAGTRQLPAYRSFALGGWGSLPGEAFRSIGGRRVAWGRVEYRLAAPAPAIPLGPFFSTGTHLVIAPFFAAGVAGGPIPGLPWRATGEVRPVAGVALELFQRMVRVETGVSLRTGRVGVSVDVDREWWEIL